MEPQSINFSKAFRNKAINSCIQNMATKSKIDIELFKNLKENVLAKVDEKIKLNQKLKPRGASQY